MAKSTLQAASPRSGSRSETKPRLLKGGKTLTAVSLAEPSFTIVEVYHALGFLLAECCVLSISRSQYQQLRRWVGRSLLKQVLHSIRSLVRQLPGFSFAGESLRAPRGYCRAIDVPLDHGLLKP